LIGRTVWSSPQHVKDGEEKCCIGCKFYANAGLKYINQKYSELTIDYVARRQHQKYLEATVGHCQNLRIWAASGEEKPPNIRSYYYCNFFERKEKEDG
jgi:hypothetical protein